MPTLPTSEVSRPAKAGHPVLRAIRLLERYWRYHGVLGRPLSRTMTPGGKWLYPVGFNAMGLLLALPVALCFGDRTRAADYPTRPVNLIVAFTPGGPSDVLARIIGRQLEKILGQTFVIDNRPGGAGNIAAETVAHAPPDGYTLLMGNNGLLATNQSLFKKLNFDGEKDFAPISLIGSQPNILVVNPKFPATTMAELIAYAKANPGKLNYANSGFGAAAHLSAELFKSEAKVDIVSVSYKGAAPALQDLIAGHVQVMFATSASVVGFLKAGTLRPLAVTTLKRFSLIPELPTVAELGLPGFDATTWHGLVAPAGTPREVIDKLNRAAVEALKDADTLRQLHDLGVEVNSSTPEEFAAYIRREIPKWAAVVKASGAQVE
jgi:tripartite-type tricarboxylate transporter receptor subunit TctC